MQLSGTHLEFGGNPNQDYEVYAAPGQCIDVSTPISVDTIAGATQVGTITTNASGRGKGTFGQEIQFVEDACYYVVCSPNLAVANSGIPSVPTLGELSIIALLLSLASVGITMNRKR